MPRTEHLLASWATRVKLKSESSEAAPLFLDGKDNVWHLAIHHTWNKTPGIVSSRVETVGSTQGDFCEVIDLTQDWKPDMDRTHSWPNGVQFKTGPLDTHLASRVRLGWGYSTWDPLQESQPGGP